MSTNPLTATDRDTTTATSMPTIHMSTCFLTAAMLPSIVRVEWYACQRFIHEPASAKLSKLRFVISCGNQGEGHI